MKAKTELTNTELMLRYQADGVTCSIYWNGGNKCSYIFESEGVELTRGNDFKPSPMHYIDSIETMVSLLSFMAVKPGDTDDDYFKYHSDAFMDWLETDRRDALNLMISDFEDTDSEWHTEAVAYFKRNVELYPEAI